MPLATPLPHRLRWRAAFLSYAAVQFVVLTTVAMSAYADRYRFFGNFLSELGATHAWSGRPNHVAMVLFGVALATVGAAFVGFSGAWRVLATGSRAVTIAGVVAQVFGVLSGLAFVAVAFTPVDRALMLHNSLVVAAFAFLIGHAVAMTVVAARSRHSRGLVVANIVYLVFVLVYAAVALAAVQQGIGTLRGREMLVVSQKIFAYGSVVYMLYVAVTLGRVERSQAARRP